MGEDDVLPWRWLHLCSKIEETGVGGVNKSEMDISRDQLVIDSIS